MESNMKANEEMDVHNSNWDPACPQDSKAEPTLAIPYIYCLTTRTHSIGCHDPSSSKGFVNLRVPQTPSKAQGNKVLSIDQQRHYRSITLGNLSIHPCPTTRGVEHKETAQQKSLPTSKIQPCRYSAKASSQTSPGHTRILGAHDIFPFPMKLEVEGTKKTLLESRLRS
ncbi:Hypothetical predicted protein [Prunus dulcis]|uniref:Uncharacterized protein n=1 Tax=Prunus dulcis TaxID=3755 RepID=A0A5E4FZC1_PRUDU|nr:Hypothetical predicted protein [Prunus dulcis]